MLKFLILFAKESVILFLEVNYYKEYPFDKLNAWCKWLLKKMDWLGKQKNEIIPYEGECNQILLLSKTWKLFSRLH